MIGELKGIIPAMQSAVRLVLPAQCLGCGGLVAEEFGLCADCWRDTPFIAGLVCDTCGVPLPGTDEGKPEHCDDCLTLVRPWSRGRAALVYKDKGRGLVLGLKHGDRLDLARPAANWMLRAAAPILRPDMLLAPVPLHWIRFLKRRFNQSALLSRAIARATGMDHCPDLLQRPRRTRSQDGRDRDGRFANLSGAIRAHPGRAARIEGRHILLIDDVMTSGATLGAAADACRAAGASDVSVLILARVAKDA